MTQIANFYTNMTLQPVFDPVPERFCGKLGAVGASSQSPLYDIREMWEVSSLPSSINNEKRAVVRHLARSRLALIWTPCSSFTSTSSGCH